MANQLEYVFGHLPPLFSDLVLLLGDDSKFGRKRVEDVCQRAVEYGPAACATATYGANSRLQALSFGDIIVPLLQVLVKVSRQCSRVIFCFYPVS